jgi:hypothetical protein
MDQMPCGITCVYDPDGEFAPKRNMSMIGLETVLSEASLFH